jgi:hypothetical protein
MLTTSSSFASAETSIQKTVAGFAMWHLDSHFWDDFRELRGSRNPLAGKWHLDST